MTQPTGALQGALLPLGLMFCSMAGAAELSVVDQATGKPLAEAVIELHGVAAAPPEPHHSEIVQRDATFHPRVTVVPIGSQVGFPNRDTTRHHVYSFSPAKTFDLELYLQDTPPPVKFDKPGVVVLGCNIHDHMQAYIVVSDAPYFAISDSRGQVSLADLPEREQALRLWHPQFSDDPEQWWEGTLHRQPTRQQVGLHLEASPPPVEELSPLQQRFRDAARQQ